MDDINTHEINALMKLLFFVCHGNSGSALGLPDVATIGCSFGQVEKVVPILQDVCRAISNSPSLIMTLPPVVFFIFHSSNETAESPEPMLDNTQIRSTSNSDRSVVS
jgi:hypothetical protein